MVLTATRSNEARGAMWSEIDLDARTWTIPAGRMKAKRTYRVPLSGRAMAILDEACTLGRATGDTLVFPGTSKGRPLAGATLLNLLARAGLDTTLHGFRSAFANWARERTNVPTAVAEAALAHTVKNAAEAAYATTDYFDKRLAPGLDRRLVHRQHPAREHMRALRRGDRRQQVDGAARPVDQGGAAERDAGVEKTLMLAVQGQVIRELVDQHSGEEAHVGSGALQHIRRRRWGENRLGVEALDDLAHVLQHHVAARLLREPETHLLADDLALCLRNRLNRRVPHLNGLDRDLGSETQPALGDRRVAHLRATLVR